MTNTYPDGSMSHCEMESNNDIQVFAGHLCASCGCDISGERSLCDDCLASAMGQEVSWA